MVSSSKHRESRDEKQAPDVDQPVAEVARRDCILRSELPTLHDTRHLRNCLMLRRLPSGMTFLALLLAVSYASAKDNPSETVTMIFVGDIMAAYDEEPGKLIERGIDPFEPCADL